MTCGDFNLVLNPDIDYFNYLHVNNPNAREKVLEIIQERCLIDPFRELYPDLKRFTWRKRTPFKQARLDFFLLSEDLLCSLKNCNIEPSYRSDHSMVVLNLEFNPFDRGRGLWKFNNSLLYDPEYIKIVKEKIVEVKKQYVIYDIDRIEDMNNEDLNFNIDSHLFLETMLMEIRGKTISYSSYKKKVKEKQEKDLRNEILILEEKVDEGSMQILENKKCELENIRKEKIKGKIIRSRIQWVEEGEKPTSYFCGLESKNFTNKIIPKVEKENGDVISKQKDILKEVKSFYENLYKNKDKSKGDKFSKLKEGLKDIKLKKLTDDEKKNLEGEITIEEAGLILKNMKNNKTPGSDGFSTEFFKFFWKDLKIFIVNSLNYSTEIGELSVTQKQGIIICLPKGNKPRHFLKNWRPISLLNTVYKIGSGVIAKRFKTV